MKRVVVTGLGAITPIGLDSQTTWENAKNGVNGIVRINEPEQDEAKIHVAGKIKDYDPLNYFSKKQARKTDLVAQYAMVAAKEAVQMAKLEEIEDRLSIGVAVGSGIGGLETIQRELKKANEKGYARVSPLFIPNAIINTVAANVAIDNDLKGPCYANVTACATGTDNIGTAFYAIQNDQASVMVAGATEAAATESGYHGFNNLKALSNSEDPDYASIPFDKNRNGFVMGEGSGVIVLEEYEHAKARGAKIYGEIVAYSSSCDAMHITAPDPEAVAAIYALNKLVKNAKIDTNQVGFINVHGTSTQLNEITESKMINEVFKENTKDLLLTSSKSMTGHLLGAAGAVEAILTILCLKENVVTPTINTKEVDEALGVNVNLELTKLKTDYAVSTSLAFGGHNSMLMFKRIEE